jgi:Tfp pilus assembly protein PilN
MTKKVLPETITKPEIQFLIMIGSVIVSVTLGYSAIATRLAVMETKQEQTIALLEKHDKREEQTIGIVDKLLVDVSTLKTIVGMK